MSGTQSLCFLEGAWGFELDDLKSYIQAQVCRYHVNPWAIKLSWCLGPLSMTWLWEKENKQKKKHVHKSSNMCNSSLLSYVSKC